ncbi:hypothetical protein [Streptococcus suis]|uniref:hypothetical protein n=1 Tax=Streptococcus suis TaxID=1307 RepID=UPI000414C7AE|nr:hypothetical protein [Streptococcus suis]HEM3170554.1 hypothetical protein [Streptococcus suis]
MPNTLEYSKIFQPVLDKQIVQESTTGWMEVNSKLVQYNGGDEVKLPSIVMDGLADYDRSSGYVDGAVTLKWNTYKLTQDRGRKFQLDAMDVDETNFVVTAGTVMGEFQRTLVVPEIDAYRYSLIASKAITAGQTRTAEITDTNIFTELLKDIAKVKEVIGNTSKLKIVMSETMLTNLKLDEKAAKRMSTVNTAAAGEVATAITKIDEHEIVPTQQSLLQTAFKFNDGKTVGQEKGGFVIDSSAKAINWLIIAENAPIAVSKTDVVRVFDPMTNQRANAWDMDYRKYHDIWIPKSKEKSIFANTVA